MSQQINLLHKPESTGISIWTAVGGFAAIFLLLFFIAAYNEIRIHGIDSDIALTQQRISDTQKILDEKRRESGLLAADAIDAEMAQIRQKINARRDLTSLIEKGEFGSPIGHSSLLTVLARLSEPGVWIQAVEVTKAGQSISIIGNALSNEAVMRYAGQLNQIFKAHQFQFTSVEMSREEVFLASDTGPKTAAMKFKLY